MPVDMDGAWRMAKVLFDSEMVPESLDSREKVFVAIGMGLEVGLSPMQAVQSIAVINKRPSIWGDAALGLVQASGALVDFRETPLYDDEGNLNGYRCRAVRKGIEDPIEHSFTVDDAKRAQLWGKVSRTGKPSPWVLYPQRMLQMRARSWTLRDGFADVLKGLQVAEEVRDYYEGEAEVISSKLGSPEVGRHDLSRPVAIPAGEQEPDAEEPPPTAKPIPPAGATEEDASEGTSTSPSDASEAPAPTSEDVDNTFEPQAPDCVLQEEAAEPPPSEGPKAVDGERWARVKKEFLEQDVKMARVVGFLGHPLGQLTDDEVADLDARASRIYNNEPASEVLRKPRKGPAATP